MDLTDLISPNTYVAQNTPTMPPAIDGGDDPIARLRALLLSQPPAPNPPAPISPAPQAPQAPQASPPPAPAAPAPSGPVARGGGPISIPLPQSPSAPAAAPLSTTPPAPTSPQTQPSSQTQPNSLLSAIAPQLAPSQPALNKFSAALGGGLSTVTGNTAGGAFARGMGGGLTAVTKYDQNAFNQRVQAVKAIQEAAQNGTNVQYKAALTNYYKVLTDQKNQQASAAETGKTSTPAAKPAATPGSEISMKGDGTQSAPYMPQTKDDYDQIASGSYYIHPQTGLLQLKK